MAKTKRQTVKAAKDARQKKIAIVGGVVLLALLAIQVPRTLNMLSSAPAPAPVPAEASPATVPAPAGAADPSSTAPAPSAPAVLVDSDPLPSRSPSHVVTFERFASKDPFVQQVSPEPPVAVTPAPVASAVAAPAPQIAAPTPQASAPAPAPTAAPAPTRAPSGSVVVEVNGKRETVALNGTFPQSDPTFRLVSVSGQTAMIGLAGGAYANGVQTIALQAGKLLTLANTADGARYELRLVAVG
jgi:hypothetical protein